MSDQNSTILVGIDGGGTGCRVAIADADRNIIGTAKGGPANPTYTPQQARDNILAAIDAARLDAGLEQTAINSARAYVGLAGIRNDTDAEFIAEILPFAQARVVEDRATTVTGALAGGDGAVAAIGTGSFVARSKGGKTGYLGGWGFRLGDQASGAWLGRNLLERVILCAEGIEPHSDLTRETLARYDDDPHAIYEFGNAATPAEFGKLAPLVVDAANKGDPTATAMMRDGADYIVKALNTLGYRPDEPLCLTGGLGPHYTNFLQASFARQVMMPKGSALDGALLLASRMGDAP
ncbi:BadF/BadG/BcrA/BcrD ATPase family protein [Profundibacter amoris]|nr:BadF/BadG/BcrA/BcrD ATPase family protein [Profundibacter amoris]